MKKFTFLSILFLFIFVFSMKAQTGQICNDSKTAMIGTNNVDHQSLYIEQWYTYVATQTAIIEIHNSGMENLNLNVWNNCMMMNQLGWDDGWGDFDISVNIPVFAGDTILLQWLDNSMKGVYSFTINENTNVPPGVSCAMATPATAGTNTADHVNGQFNQWFTYTASQTSIIEIRNYGEPNAFLTVYSGFDCAHLVWIDGLSGWNDTLSIDYVASAGETIYLQWQKQDSLTTYNFTINENTIDLKPGMACNNAIPATLGVDTVDHNGGTIDQWFTYTASQTSIIEIRNFNLKYASLELYSGFDCANKVWVAFDDGWNDSIVSIDYVATMGEQLFLHWTKNSNLTASYTFDLNEDTSLAPGMSCNNAKTATTGINPVDHQNGTIDQWFTYTPPSDQLINIISTGQLDANLTLFEGSDCLNKMWMKQDNGMNDTVSISYIAKVGKTIYLQWSNSPSLTTYFFNLSVGPIPPGIDCENALVADTGVNTVAPIINSLPQWYTYTATQDANIKVTSFGQLNSNLSIYSGSNCMNLMWQAGMGWMDTIVVNYHAMPGEKIYLQWMDNNMLPSYDFTLTESIWVPSGAMCEEAKTAVIGNNLADHEFGSKDQWFTYTATQNAVIEIRSYGQENANLTLFSGAACMNQMWISQDDGWGDSTVSINYIAFPGEVLHLNWMNSASLNTYNFTIAENTNIPQGISCENAQPANLGVNTADHYNGTYYQWFTYTASQDAIVTITQNTEPNANLTLYNGSDCMNHMWIASDDAWNDSIINLNYVAKAGEVIYLNWMNNPMLTTYNFTISEDSNVPAGASCDFAIPAVIGDNTCNHVVGVDQWFTYEVTENSLFTVTNCADTVSPDDTYFEVYMGPFCSNPMWLAGDNMTCGLKSEASFQAFVGDIILIKWLGPNNGYNVGTYTWALEQTLLPPGINCQNPIIANLGTNTADHQFGKFEQNYTYTASQNALIEISSCGADSFENTFVEVWTGDCMMMNNDVSNDDACGLQSTVGIVANAGDLIHIRWAAWLGANTYNWTITENTNIPPGISCKNANLATLGSNNIADHSGGAYNQWFTYTVANNSLVKITSCGYTPENTSSNIYTGSDCDNLMYKVGSGGTCDTAVYIASAGEILYIEWTNYNLSDSVVPYNFSITEDTNLPPGISCGNAITATLGSNAVDNDGFAKWYTYTAANDGYLTISTCGETEDTYVEVYKTCADFDNYNYIVWNGEACGMQAEVNLAVTTGESYLIRWAEWSVNNPYNFTISENATLPAGVICDNPIIASLGTNTSDHTAGEKVIWYKYTSTVDGKLTIKLDNTNNWHWLQAYKGGCPNSGGFVINNMNGEITSWVSTGDEIYYSWEDYNSTSFTYTISEEVIALPQGLSCSNPIIATEGLQQTDLFDGAKWYKYTPASSGSIRVSSCGLTWADTYFNVYTDCLGTEVAFGEDCGMQSTAEFNIQGGTDYFILWNTQWPDQIQWELNVLSVVAIQLSVATTDATCGNDNGSATVTATGGTAPYTYQWTSGSVDATASDLPAGMYVVTVKDADNNESSYTVTINDDSGLSIAETVTDVSCKGDNTGSIDVTITGGASPYTYEWSNGVKTEDVTGLLAGPYDLVVTDANSCIVLKSIQVNQPSGIYLSFNTDNSSCGSSDGTATASVAGGTSPYTYKWSNNASTATVNNLAAGAYSLTITDANVCKQNASVQINDKNAPTIQIDSVNQSSCGTSDADIFVSVTGGAGSNTYSWSNGSSVQDLIHVGPGEYSLTVTDANTCKAITSAEILGSTPDTVEICMVTVDTTSGMNMVVWGQSLSSDIDYYNIYKETTSAGVYNLIASVPSTELSLYVDTVSDPRVRSWRYKISAVDNCGNESELSQEHKTIHLTINYGFFGDVNLIWDDYKGFTFSSFSIMRNTVSGGWEELTQLPSNLTSYTDVALTNDTKSYVVSVIKGSDCLATIAAKKANAGPFSRSLSNLEDNRLQSSNNIKENNIEMSVYPNPTAGLVYINANSDINTISIMDITGKVMNTQNVNAKNTEVNFAKYSAGVYFIEISGQDMNQIVKIIKD